MCVCSLAPYLCLFISATRKSAYPFGTAWMELEIMMLSEIGQVVKDKYHMISPLRGN